MKPNKKTLKASLWTGLLLIISCVIPIGSQVFPVLEGFADQAFAANISGTVFNDANPQNGTLDTVETGASWVTVTLDGTTNLIPDATGAYSFIGANSETTTIHVPADYPTIQEAINAAAIGATINVAAGTYDEDLTINKSLTLLGAGSGSTTIRGVIGGTGATIQVGASNVTVAGFTITRLGNNPIDWNNSSLNFAGIAVQGTAITGMVVRDNALTGNRTGIDINNSSGHTIRNNVIMFNRTGLILRNQTDNLTVVENEITNNWTVGILFLDASNGINTPVQTALNCTFRNNSISGNWYGQIVDRQTGGSLPAPGTNLKNFSSNWLGTSTPVVSTANSSEPGYAALIPVAYGGSAVSPGGMPEILGPASANIDFTPYLNSGLDTNIETTSGSGTNGFQGDFSNLWVTATGAQTGTTGRIQEGINLVSGSTVNVAAGTYVENVIVNKSVTLAGAGESTIIQPVVSAPNPCTGSSLCGGSASNVILVQANDVIIHDLTVDGDNPSITSGIVRDGADIDARNGIIKNTTGTFNNLEVYNTTVKNIYLRGIYSTGGSFNFHHNTVTNVQGDDYSIAMFAWYGPGTMANNTVSYANDGIAANHSKGIQFLNNTVTHSLSGVHTDNAGDGGGTADVIQDNSVDCTDTPGAYGVWTFVPYLAPTVHHNTVTNCSVGLSAWGQGAGVTTPFSNNTVNGPAREAGSVGVYITTDLISWGYTDVSVNFTCNDIKDNETGIYLTADQQGWNPEPYQAKTITASFSSNNITGNMYGLEKGNSGTYNVTATNNWWGDASGPYNEVSNPAGTGDSVTDGVAFLPWSLVPFNGCTPIVSTTTTTEPTTIPPTTTSEPTTTTSEPTTTTSEEPTTTTTEPGTTTIEPSTTTSEELTTTTSEPTTTTTEPSTTTVPNTDCITIDPTSVTVNGVDDETLDVVVTFTRTDIWGATQEQIDKLVIEVDTTCAQYITINSSTINIGETEASASLNITVQGDAPASECSIKISDPESAFDPPLNCVASFTIFSSPITTTTTIPTTTTTVPQPECTVTVRSTILPLNAGLLPHVRRIEITGKGSNWDRTSAVSIEDIRTVIPLRVQPTRIYALIVIPGTLFGRFTPGEKAVGVATGAELCTGTVDIP